MKKTLHVAVVVMGIWSPSFAGKQPQDVNITQMLADIEGASERGDFEKVQILRMRLADHSAKIGQHELAVRQYDLLLAGRPGKADRVRYCKRLGNSCMALEDYSRAIQAYQRAGFQTSDSVTADIGHGFVMDDFIMRRPV